MSELWNARMAAGGAAAAQVLANAVSRAARRVSLATAQRALIVLLVIWIAASLVRAIWSFFPEAPPLPPAAVINPPTAGVASGDSVAQVDIDALVATHLFGEPGAEPLPADPAASLAASGRPPALSEEEAAAALAGIEDGAPETRLPLILRGVVAASEAGLGQAVIEHRNAQDLYQVGDELPVNSEVALAKVLPDRVVLDNAGRYEVLRLFEGGELSGQLTRVEARPERPVAPPGDESADAENPAGAADVAQIAAEYRDRVYSDPQSLADVIRVTAVREGTELVGYRVSPGSAGREFSALGFQAGDIVTAVNGLSLRDPSNTLRLYEDMRSAQEANFDVIRQGETLNLSVSIAQLAVE